MARTSAIKVEGIIEVEETIDLAPFIEVAGSLVTECCGGSGYNAERLELIERWLSAHFYALRDQRPASEGVGTVNVAYQYRVDLGFNQTIYGQQAMLLDTAGGLAALQKRTQTGGARTIGVVWAGTDRSRE